MPNCKYSRIIRHCKSQISFAMVWHMWSTVSIHTLCGNAHRLPRQIYSNILIRSVQLVVHQRSKRISVPSIPIRSSIVRLHANRCSECFLAFRVGSFCSTNQPANDLSTVHPLSIKPLYCVHIFIRTHLPNNQCGCFM